METTELTRSPNIQNKIDEFKLRFKRIKEEAKNKSELEQVKLQRKEASKELRMETAIINAQLIELTIKILLRNPEISKSDFIDEVKKSGKVLFPDKTEKFIDNLLYKRLLVKGIINTTKGEDTASILYHQLLPQEKRPATHERKNITLYYYPLAIVLEMDETDFEEIDPRDNIGGFHSSFHSFHLFNRTWKAAKSFVTPLIVAKKGNKRIIPHEQVHAEHSTIRTALDSIKEKHTITDKDGVIISETEEVNKGLHRVVWGSWNSITRAIEAKNTLLEKTKKRSLLTSTHLRLAASFHKGFLGLLPVEAAGIPPAVSETMRSSEELQQLVSYGLACAKEEILAEMHGSYGTGPAYLENLIKKGGVYDYFVKHLQIPEDSILHQTLWKEYVKQLKEQTKYAYELFVMYKNNICWSNRLKIFRYILLQWPVEQWNKQLEAAGFIEEMQLYNQIHSGEFRIDEELRKNTQIGVDNLTEDEKNLLDGFDIFYFSINNMIYQNPDSSKVAYLRRRLDFLQHVLNRNIESQTLYQKVKLYKDIDTTFSQIAKVHATTTSTLLPPEIHQKINDHIDQTIETFDSLNDFLSGKEIITIERLTQDSNTLSNILEQLQTISKQEIK